MNSDFTVTFYIHLGSGHTIQNPKMANFTAKIHKNIISID